MRFHRLLGRALTAAVVVMATATGCSSSSGKETIRVGVGVDAAYAPLFLAVEEGLFEDAGLDVKLVQYARGAEAVQALASNEVQMAANSDGSTISLIQQNPDLRFLDVFGESGSYMKVAAREGISDASKIKKMGFVPGMSQYSATRYLESQNVDPSTVEFVQSDPPTLPALLEKGTVDAFVLWEPWPAKATALNGTILSDTGSFDVRFRMLTVANQAWLDDNTELAAKFAAVLDKAAKKVADDPDAGAKATESQTSIPSEQTVGGIKEIQWVVRAFDEADIASFEDIAKAYAEIGATSSKVDVARATLTDWYTKNGGE